MRSGLIILMSCLIIFAPCRRCWAEDWLPNETLGYAVLLKLDTFPNGLAERTFPLVHEAVETRGFPFSNLTIIALPGKRGAIEFALKLEVAQGYNREDVIGFLETALGTELVRGDKLRADYTLLKHPQAGYAMAVADRQVWVGQSGQVADRLVRRALVGDDNDNLLVDNRRLKMCKARLARGKRKDIYCQVFVDIFRIDRATGIFANLFAGDDAEKKNRLLALSEGVAFMGEISLDCNESSNVVFLDSFILATRPRSGVWRLLERDIAPQQAGKELPLILKTPVESGAFVQVNVDPKKIEEFGGEFLDEFILPDNVGMNGSDLISNMLGTRGSAGARGQLFYSFNIRNENMTLVRGTRFEVSHIEANMDSLRERQQNAGVECIEFDDGYSIETSGSRFSTIPIDNWILSGEHSECLRLRNLISSRNQGETKLGLGGLANVFRNAELKEDDVRCLAILSLKEIDFEDAVRRMAPGFMERLEHRVKALEKAEYEGLNAERRQKIFIDEIGALYRQCPPTLFAIIADEYSGIRLILGLEINNCAETTATK